MVFHDNEIQFLVSHFKISNTFFKIAMGFSSILSIHSEYYWENYWIIIGELASYKVIHFYKFNLIM